MRIVIVNQFYAPDISPTAQLSASLAERLAASGHDVTAVASAGGYVTASRTLKESASGIRVHRVWTPQLGKGSIVKRCVDYLTFYVGCLWRMIALRKQDVVICLTTPPYIALTGMVHRWMHPGTKLILWNMDCYPDVAERAGVIRKGGIASRVMRTLNRLLLKRVDHLVCLDEAMVELMVGQYGPRRMPGRPATTIIPNWERESFFPGDEEPAAWEGTQTLGLEGKFVVLYMGNMGVGHSFATVIAAARQVRELPVVFLFVGGGKRWKELEESRAREGLDNVILHAYVQKELIRGVMAAADCALITLSEEMLGVMSPSKLHSNLAMGLPVVYVGPQKSNVDEAIGRFGSGVSLREGDVEGLVGFIEQSLADPVGLANLQLRARQAFEAAYCDTRTLPQFEAVIEGLWASPGCRAPGLSR